MRRAITSENLLVFFCKSENGHAVKREDESFKHVESPDRRRCSVAAAPGAVRLAPAFAAHSRLERTARCPAVKQRGGRSSAPPLSSYHPHRANCCHCEAR